MAAPQFSLNSFLRDKILAALVALGVYYLQTISHELADLGKTLAVAVQRVDDLDRRVSNIETKLFPRNENEREEARPRRD